jgi:uncharacterized protein
VKIDFNEIPEEGLSLTVEDAEWFPAELERAGRVTATLRLRKSGRRVIVTGAFSASVRFECDRCLEEFTLPLDTDFRMDLELADDSAPDEEEMDHFCHDAEMDMDILDSSEIDTDDILRQQLYLAVPMKKLCSEGCRGICGKCGANLNVEECRCPPETSSPFAVLGRLKG